MLELRLVGVHDDGENLVLESADGTRFALPIDMNLRTSITKARRIQPARGLGTKGSFGPRDIQTRFRQGASVEEIAEESGWEPERVRRYEWPIVAERAHIIRAAQGVKVGRRSSASGLAQIPVTLASRIADVTAAHGFAEAAQDWSTRQKDNGQWSIEVDFALTPRDREELPARVMFPARWVYNPANQSLYASNEAAYFLMGNAEDEVYDTKKQEEEPQPSSQPKAPSSTGSGASSVADVPVAVATGVAPVDASRVSSSTIKGTSPDERKLNELLERARSVSRPGPTTQQLRVVAQPSTVTVTEDSDSANNTTDSSRHREQVRAQGAASQGAAHRGVSSPQDSADESPQEPVDDRDVASFSAGDGSFYGRRAGRETSSPERGTAGTTPEPREERRFGGQEHRRPSIGGTFGAPRRESAGSTENAGATEGTGVRERAEHGLSQSSRPAAPAGAERDTSFSTQAQQRPAQAETTRADTATVPTEGTSAESKPEPAETKRHEKPKSSGRNKQRMSVPAWDEIIFGGRK